MLSKMENCTATYNRLCLVLDNVPSFVFSMVVLIIAIAGGTFIMATEPEFRSLASKTQAMGEGMEAMMTSMINRETKFEALTEMVAQTGGSVVDLKASMVNHNADMEHLKTQLGNVIARADGNGRTLERIETAMGRQSGDLDAIRRQICKFTVTPTYNFFIIPL